MTEWQKADIYDFVSETDKETISEIIFEALIDMGYTPDEIEWDFNVEFVDGFYRKKRENYASNIN